MFFGFSKENPLKNTSLTLFSDLTALSFTCRLCRSQDTGMRNHTSPASFVLLGIIDDSQLKILIFIFLLITYMLSVTENLTIIILILVKTHLQTDMHFSLQNFSFLEISFTSTCIPRFLNSISTGDKTITYNACSVNFSRSVVSDSL